jgi:hypothetical protein
MYVISNELLDLVSGGDAPAGNSTATAGNASASCAPGTVPVAVAGNLTGSVGPVRVEGLGSVATCVPVGSLGGGSGGGDGSNTGSNDAGVGGDENKRKPKPKVTNN